MVHTKLEVRHRFLRLVFVKKILTKTEPKEGIFRLLLNEV
jgi:hypothetical protein